MGGAPGELGGLTVKRIMLVSESKVVVPLTRQSSWKLSRTVSGKLRNSMSGHTAASRPGLKVILRSTRNPEVRSGSDQRAQVAGQGFALDFFVVDNQDGFVGHLKSVLVGLLQYATV